MRHGKRNNALSRTSSHRKAMLSNMACSLIEHKRITTTVAKAKELRKFVEPLITKSKTDSTHSRRVVFSNLKSKDATSELFREVAPKVASRPGGYTRIIKLGTRLGDAAEMCMIELVDYNEIMLKEEKSGKTRRSRSRRGGKKKSGGEQTAQATESKTAAPEPIEVKSEETLKAEAPKAEAKKEESPKADASAESSAAKEEKKATEATEATVPKEEPKAEKEDTSADSSAGETKETKAEATASKEKKEASKAEAPKAEKKEEGDSKKDDSNKDESDEKKD